MTKYRPVLYAIGIVLVGMFYVRACWEPSIRADERQRSVDRRDDSTVARLAYEVARAGKQLQRERDSTGRVIARLRTLVLPKDRASRIMGNTPDSSNTQLAMRDSLIASLLSGREQDSLQLLFWRGQVAQRDSLIASLRSSRDAWRAQSRKRFACVGGATAAVGLSGQSALGVGVTCGYKL